MKTTLITFSPTGGTQKCATELASALGEIIQKIDLTISPLNVSPLSEESELALIAVPSYGGRVPSLAAERLKKIQGQGKKAILLVVYGNRAFEDTLAELEDIAKAQGFIPIAAASAIAQHCMDEKIATGRPDAQDLQTLREFGQKIAEKIASGNFSEPVIPGNRPYKTAGAGMQPATDKNCTSCGLCAKHCPAGAISPANPSKIDSAKCLGCMRCVTLCPAKSKHLPAAKRLLIHTFLSLAAGKRKEPQLFI